MANNKVQLANGTVLIDITDTTANASDVLSGEYFYDASGVKTEGSLTIPSTYTITKNLSHINTNNNDTEVLSGGSFYMDLTLEAGYKYIDSVTVIMDGIDITEQVFKAGIGEKTITQNGIYDAEDDWLGGYSSVNVNVPNSYSVSDEGKVVSNGTLVSQNPATYTLNGTYDTTLVNNVTINVSGSITPTGTKQFNITENGIITDDVTNYANVEITTNVQNGLPYNILLISSLFNSKYQHDYIRTGSAPTVSQYYSSGILIQGGASKVQKAYVRIGPIDLTNIKSIQSVTSYSSSNNTSKSYYSRLYISQNTTDAAYEVPANQLDTYRYTGVTTGYNNALRTLDVSDFSGNYYIFTGTDSGGESWSATRNVTVHTIVFSEDSTPFYPISE